jgi:hypothetical protein
MVHLLGDTCLHADRMHVASAAAQCVNGMEAHANTCCILSHCENEFSVVPSAPFGASSVAERMNVLRKFKNKKSAVVAHSYVYSSIRTCNPYAPSLKTTNMQHLNLPFARLLCRARCSLLAFVEASTCGTISVGFFHPM